MRPTSDRVRLALFNRLGDRVPESRVLDLFAGGGGLGIEALSRGASHVLFVEGDRRVAAVLRDNLHRLGAGNRARVWQQDVFAVLAKLGKAGAVFDLVLADPPYRQGLAARVPGAVAEANLLAPGGVLVVEHDRREELPASAGALARTAVRRYGDTCLSYYEAVAPAAGGSDAPTPRGRQDPG